MQVIVDFKFTLRTGE